MFLFIKQFNQFFSSSIQVILWFFLNQLIDSFDKFYNFNYPGVLSIKISWMCCWIPLGNVLFSTSLRILPVTVLFRISECACDIHFLYVYVIGFLVGGSTHPYLCQLQCNLIGLNIGARFFLI